ncbi:CAP domain-containing protein [Thermaerobacillus caldiproteolyticus]|uniref:Uncharacterized protein YkwD n=1 Tax=Thermaerobacillus caldiproteolyticus TaxID=247480 RepID=A0A7V9Z4X1_9BACL|nr:CAP domain-containing protein [Anoxybacillus caldiproteolyticus]MBA2874113.1 uncharacterized protein YkwD [Anoxybacillus caldiproteolyticus]QPA31935.1 CAP domain-containing protein [Anoxybacillus caldiproteolyticus]
MKWFLFILLFIIGFYYFVPSATPPLSPPQKSETKDHPIKEPKVVNGLLTIIGKTEEDVKKQFGQPTRIDDSAYGYKWWIYNKHANTYLQIGIRAGRAVTAFTCGEQVNVKPFRIGQPLQEVFNKVPIPSNVDVSLRTGTYRFELSEQDLASQPIVKVSNVYVQLYIDRFTGKVSSIRLMNGETLVKLRPYELVYRGTLPSASPLSPEERKKVEMANAYQIFDITNVIRQRYGVKPLHWHEKTAQVAYEHSKDMKENRYFSHESPTRGDLKDRLLSAGIKFQMAGENIAAQHIDAIAAVEGWLNSKSHRETLLNGQFTHLGVGVADKYYTQNFLKPW